MAPFLIKNSFIPTCNKDLVAVTVKCFWLYFNSVFLHTLFSRYDKKPMWVSIDVKKIWYFQCLFQINFNFCLENSFFQSFKLWFKKWIIFIELFCCILVLIKVIDDNVNGHHFNKKEIEPIYKQWPDLPLRN